MRYFYSLCLTLSLIACNKPEAPKVPAPKPQVVAPFKTITPLAFTVEKIKTSKPKCKGEDCPYIEVEINRFTDDQELSALVEHELVNLAASPNEIKPTYVGLTDLTKDFWPKSEGQWNLFLQSQVVYQKNNVIVIELNSDAYLGGAHGILNTRYLMIDRNTHLPISLADVLMSGKDADFWALVQAQHQAWIKQYELDDADTIKVWPFMTTDNVALTDQGLSVKYQAYDIGPYALGQPEFVVPYSQLKGMIKPAFL